jgi:hypothetical protein
MIKTLNREALYRLMISSHLFFVMGSFVDEAPPFIYLSIGQPMAEQAAIEPKLSST